jgi:hypothetical protein
LPAALPVTQAPNGALLLQHLSAIHPDQVRRIDAGEDITTVVAEAFDVVEEAPDGGATGSKL